MVNYYYYIGPWAWDVTEGIWKAPLGGISGIDFDTIPSQSVKGNLMQLTRPKCFFYSETPIQSALYTLLGRGDLRTIQATTKMKSDWEGIMGYLPTGTTLADLVMNHLTTGSDSIGVNACKPLMPTIQNNLELNLSGHSLIRTEKFTLEHPHAEKVIETLQLDFKSQYDFLEKMAEKTGNLNIDHPRRMLDVWCQQYKTDNWKLFVPSELRNKVPGTLPHQTTVSDNFNRADGDLAGSTASGGGTWSEPQAAQDWAIVSNEAKSTVNAQNWGRLDNDLSSSDHYAQVVMTTNMTGRGGATVRCASGAVTFYIFYNRKDANTFGTYKDVAGSITQIGTDGSFTYSPPHTIKTEINGSTLTGYIDGVSKISNTDTAITGNTRGGIWMLVPNAAFDNFEAADLSATTVDSRFIQDFIRPGFIPFPR